MEHITISLPHFMYRNVSILDLYDMHKYILVNIGKTRGHIM